MNAQTKIETPKGLDLLRQPFPAHQISKLPKGNVWLDYVGHAALTDRLLDADPFWNWEPLTCDDAGLPAYDACGGLWIKLTVCGITRLGYGHAGAKKGGDAIKEVIGDALRNAAMRFGAALDLWHKGDLHVDDDDRPSAKSDAISAEDLAKVQMLLKATGIDEITFLRGIGAPQGALVCEIPASLAAEAIERLEAKLAKMAKAKTNADFGEVLADEIPY